MKALLQAWVDALPDAALIVDPETLRVVTANAEADILVGLADSCIGAFVGDLLCAPEDLLFWAGLATGHSDSIHSETRLRTARGRSVPVERKVARIWLTINAPYYLVCLRDLGPSLAQRALLEDCLADLRATLESSHDALLITDMQGNVRHCNHRFAKLWQLPAELLEACDQPHWWRHANYLACCSLDERFSSLCPQSAVTCPQCSSIALRDGRTLEHRMVPQMRNGAQYGMVHSYRDITDEVQHARQTRLASKVFASSADGILVAGSHFTVLQANPACAQLLQLSPSEILNLHIVEIFNDPEDSDFFFTMSDSLRSRGHWSGELECMNLPGSCKLGVTWVAAFDEAGNVDYTVCFLHDLTERCRAQQRISQLVTNDPLTTLPNRATFCQRAEPMLRLAQLQSRSCGLLLVNLDRFKRINESFGTSAGDRVLVEVAKRLRYCLGEIDTLGRLGSDEFVLFLREADALSAGVMARRIMAELRNDFAVDEMRFSLGCSIGIALSPDDGSTVDSLIQNADTAMQDVKARGRGSLRFYQPQKSADSLTRIKVEHAMRRGLEEHRFHLVYQPQIALADGRLMGVEALLRWKTSEFGDISPSNLISLAEESGFIIPLGNWVVEEAMRQAVRWQHMGMPTLVSVNVSALQFHQSDFVELLENSLRRLGLWPHLLELELTESILIQTVDEAMAKMHALADLGIRLSIDDFGTGYSSLGYLKKFPITKLKLDRTFVMGLPHDESDKAIVGATVTMAHALGLAVVAEGVETEAQRACLEDMRCASYQGFLCSPGLAPPELEQLARRLHTQTHQPTPQTMP